MNRPDRAITPTECSQQATLYAEMAAAEESAGMRAALLRISSAWIIVANDIERLPVVREINRLPATNQLP